MRQIALGFIFGIIVLLGLAGIALYLRIDAMVAIADVMDKNEGFFVGSFTASLFIATVFLWLSTYSLWRAEERHLKHLTETSKRELRAYVHLKQVDFPFSRYPQIIGTQGPIPGPIHTFHLAPILENSGQTPTRHGFVAMNYQCMNNKLPPDFTFPDLESDKIEAATIGPRSTFFAPVINIPVEDVDRAIAGTRYLYAWDGLIMMIFLKGLSGIELNFVSR
jgi:hypothetical protein